MKTLACPEARIVEVTVSEDRAHVVRRAVVALEAGPTRLVVEDVAPVLVDKTLNVSAGAGVVVAGARVERRKRVAPSERPIDVAALDAEVDELSRIEADVRRAVNRLEMDLSGLHQAATQLLADAETDAAWARLDAAWVHARLVEIEEDESRKRAEWLGRSEELRDREAELGRLRARREAKDDTRARAAARLVIDLVCEAAIEAPLRIDYVVPGASWRPQHTARLVGKELTFSTDGCVWQNTGEAWTDAAIVLSTERPSLGREPPRLVDDRLEAQRKQESVVVEARQVEVQSAGLGAAAPAAEGRVTPVVPGIDDGGEARSLASQVKVSVASDGRPHRVPLASFRAPAEGQLVMMPSLTLLAIRKTVQTNAASQPILAGPVDLVEESGLVGRTRVLFVAPGERFELGWGPDPGVRARRTVEEVDEDPSALSSWVSRAHRVEVTISALDRRARSIAVTEAVPVSEMEKVQIRVDARETTDAAAPDGDGFVKWNVRLEPHGRTRVKLRYVVRRHKEVQGL